MRALIVLCAAALAMGLGGCKKHDASDTSDSGGIAPPMEQPSQTPPPPESTSPSLDQPSSSEAQPAEQAPSASPDSSETTPPPAESPPPNQ